MLNEHVLEPASGGAAASAVILLHGLGDSGGGLIGLGEAWASALPSTAFHAPDAPDPCDMAPYGFQWFSLQDRSFPAMEAGVRKVAPVLDAYIDQVLARRGLAPSRVALVGFSQGTMMSLFVAPRLAAALAGVVGYSGALIGGEALGAERRSAPPFLLVHGTADEVVPFAALGRAEAGLQANGLAVTTLVRPGLGHSIDHEGLAAWGRFLRGVW